MRLVFLAILALVLSLSALPQGAMAAAPAHGCAAGAGHMAAPMTEAKAPVSGCAQMALCTYALVPEAVAFAAHFVLQPSHIVPETGLAARRIDLPLDLPPPRA
ncbi:hypothetical protein E0K89_019790 [Aquicoccus sp. SCR17]|nr:hypothetical protein [Carideicomes alvinocaridis]